MVQIAHIELQVVEDGVEYDRDASSTVVQPQEDELGRWLNGADGDTESGLAS